MNSYELGWRLNQDTGLNLGLTGFYNTSDKVVQFNSDRSVNVVDTDQRVYGAEATVSYPFMENYKVGGTLGYTRGQYEPYRVCRRVNILRDYPDDKIKIYP